MAFPHDAIRQLADAREVVVETREGDRAISTIIWVVAVDGELYIRSFLGDEGRWFQRVLENPEVTLRFGATRVGFRAVSAIDDKIVTEVSNAFVEKYPAGLSLESMIRPEVLHTTLRLEPAHST